MTTTYAYDPDSNRCAVNAGSCSASFAYNAADEITASPGTTYSYDARGDVTSTLGGTQNIFYDGADHVTETMDSTARTATVVNDEVSPSGRVLQTSSYAQGGVTNTADSFFGFSSASSDSPAYTEPAVLSILGLNVGANGSTPTDYVNAQFYVVV